MKKLNERRDVEEMAQGIQSLYMKGIEPYRVEIDYTSKNRSIDFVTKIDITGKNQFTLDISGEFRVEFHETYFEANLNYAERIDESSKAYTLIYEDFIVDLLF